MEKSAFLFYLVFMVGVYAEMPTCVDPPIENCVLSDETVHATDNETVWKTTEILLHHQVAQNFLSSGKNFTIFWSDDLLLSNGPNIVNKQYADHYRGRWDITEHIIFTHNDNEWGKVVINVTVPDFQARDQIYLKVVLHLADGDTLISPKKYWFVYDQNNPAHTTTSPSPTPNITDRNTTGKEDGTERTDIQEDNEQDHAEEEEHNEDGTQEGKSSQISTTTIITGSIMALVILCLCLNACWMRKELNSIHSLMSTHFMPLSQIDTDGQQPQGSRPDTEHLPMSAVVTQDT